MNKYNQDLASILAGLGLFFVGIKQLRSHLKQITGPRFTAVLTRMSDDRRFSALWGALVGFITQSGRVTSMILASLTSGGVLTIARALPAVVWSNVGASLIVLSAILPMNLLVLLIIGVSGICFAFEFPRKQMGLYGAAFSLAMFMFGLSLIKISAEHVLQPETLAWMTQNIGTSEPLAFVIGLMLTIATQSHIGVILITAALAHTKVFTLGQLAMIVYGAHAGSSAVTYLFGSKSFQGSSRQLIMAQTLYNVIGVALFLMLHAVERMFGVPLMLSAATSLGNSPGEQTAFLTVTFNVVTAITVSLAMPRFLRLLEWAWPPHDHEELARPRYVNTNAVNEPETAAILVAKEQLRLLKRLPDYLQSLRTPAPDAPPNVPTNIHLQHTAFHEVTHRTEQFLVQVLRRSPAVDVTESLLNLQNRLGQLSTLEDDFYVFCETLTGKSEGSRAEPLLANIVEALDTAILTAIEAVGNDDPAEFELLAAMTGDKGNVIRAIRSKYLALEHNLPADDRALILQATSLFERAVWTIGRYGLLASSAHRSVN